MLLQGTLGPMDTVNMESILKLTPLVQEEEERNCLEAQNWLHREGHQSVSKWPKMRCQIEKKGSPRDLIV